MYFNFIFNNIKFKKKKNCYYLKDILFLYITLKFKF